MIVSKKATTAAVNKDLKLLARIEVWDANYGEKSNRKVGNLVPMHREHFDECKASGAFNREDTGKPTYFTRGPEGIEFAPACDKDYWLEPVWRQPVTITRGAPSDDGSLQIQGRGKARPR